MPYSSRNMETLHRTPKSERLKRRVVDAAEQALTHHKYVSSLDILKGSGLLTPAQIESWRKGQIDFLERVIQTNLSRISLAMRIFRKWALGKGLKPSETRYVRRVRGAAIDLQFSKSGDPGIEKSYRTHYVSPDLSERKKNLNSE